MNEISRRAFLKTTAGAAALGVAGSILPSSWSKLYGADMSGYFQSEFDVSDGLCHKVLAAALARGGDFADLYFEHTVSNYIVLEDGKVNRAFSSVDLGVGIRTVKGDQVGYGFTQEFGEQAMLDAAAIAATIADGLARTPSIAFQRLETINYYPLNRLMSEVPLQSKLPLVEKINKRCFALSPLVVKVTAQFHDQEKRIMVVTSDGVKAEDLLPRNYLAAVVVAEKDDQREQAWHNLGGRRQFDFYNDEAIEKICSKAVRDAEIQFDAVAAPAGEMPVVLGSRVMGVLLHEAIGHGLEADFNRKNVSTYSAMIGEKVAEPFVTIIDDGTVSGLLGSINVDDEATLSQRTVLVDAGILTSYMHDRISAKHYGLKPTGNGRRESYRHHVMPRMRNTLMLAGPAKPEDLVRQAGNGIYVEDVSNGEVKIGEGDFSFYVTRGRLIENGKLTAPIKDINIMGNGPKMLQDITLVADDVEFSQGGTGHCGKSGQMVPVGDGQPSCLARSLTVGGVTS